MFWKKMSTAEVEEVVKQAVEKATAKSDAILTEERRRTNYIRAAQAGQFNTRSKIYEYFRAYEGLSPEEALKMTDLECLGRGIGEDGKAPEMNKEKSAMEQIGSELTNYLVKSLQEDPIETITNVGQIVGGAVSFGTGLLAGKAISKSNEPEQTQEMPIDQPIEAPMSYEEMKAQEEAANIPENPTESQTP